jgi:hypothetical protein
MYLFIPVFLNKMSLRFGEMVVSEVHQSTTNFFTASVRIEVLLRFLSCSQNAFWVVSKTVHLSIPLWMFRLSTSKTAATPLVLVSNKPERQKHKQCRLPRQPLIVDFLLDAPSFLLDAPSFLLDAPSFHPWCWKLQGRWASQFLNISSVEGPFLWAKDDSAVFQKMGVELAHYNHWGAGQQTL